MSELYETLNKGLYKLSPTARPQVYEISPEQITSGTSTSEVEQNVGNWRNGKLDFTNVESGYILGVDQGVAKFYIGDATNYLNWDGTTLTISGTISAGAIDIGGADATSFHVDSAGNTWWGAATFGAAPASISSAGDAVFNSIIIAGVILDTQVEAAANTGSVAKAADTTRTVTAAAYAKIKEFAILVDGSYDVYFALRNTTGSGSTFGRIYKNGVAAGTERSNATTSFVAYNETISGLVAGDLIQLYAYKTIDNGEVTTFRLRAVIIPNATVNTD